MRKQYIKNGIIRVSFFKENNGKELKKSYHKNCRKSIKIQRDNSNSYEMSLPEKIWPLHLGHTVSRNGHFFT